MKRGVLNYSMTWEQDGEKHEEIFPCKLSAIKAYLNKPCSHDNISSLRLWETYKSGKVEDITWKVNSFLDR